MKYDPNLSLCENLKAYTQSDILPMHMPGHKQKNIASGDGLPWQFDITEIDGFDDLHDPQACLLSIQKKIERLYGSPHSRMLVGGSTCGILSAVGTCAYNSDSKKIIAAENCHKSVYHAAELFGLSVERIPAEKNESFHFCGSISLEKLEALLQNREKPCAVVITSPTYEGILSDVRSISNICHHYQIPLIVDEAHGAHLGLSEVWPLSAVQQGADISVDSLHKTLPALTQTAVLHFRSDFVDEQIMDHMLDIFETSSPSYVLMASIECCIDFLILDAKKELTKYRHRLQKFYVSCRSLKHLSVLSNALNDTEQDRGALKQFAFDHDPGKIVILCGESGLSGTELAEKLRNEFQIEPEMAGRDHVICMTSIMDETEAYDRLYSALLQTDNAIQPDLIQPDLLKRHFTFNVTSAEAEGVFSCRDALRRNYDLIEYDLAQGCISGEYIWAYPPGIPIVMPGTVITAEAIEQLKQCEAAGLSMKKLRRSPKGYIAVIQKIEEKKR